MQRTVRVSRRRVTCTDLARKNYLEVVIDVCHAVEFAHDRKIIHRDLKPRNIMVGNFGDVYLIDWGLGMYVGDEEPPAEVGEPQHSTGPAGTPGFMAPEMVDEESRELGPATDQYLLGGVVHFVVTGDVPHRGSTPTEAMINAYRAEQRSYPDEVPSELSAIINRAMARRPEERFPDVAALREALEAFLEHDHSRQLTRRAVDISEEIREQIDNDVSDDLHFAEIYHQFGEARFGFREAIEIWEDNPEAQEGLQELMEMGTRWALQHQFPEIASVFLEEMPEPISELADRVRELASRIDERKAQGLFFEESPNAIAVVDGSGEMTFVNRRLVELFGYESGELLGERIETLMPERFRERHRRHVERYVEAPSARPMGTDLQLTGETKDGEEIPIDIELNPVESGDGTLVMAAVEPLEDDRTGESPLGSPTCPAILKHLPDAVLAESDGIIRYANSTAVDILGVENLESLLGEPLGEYLDPVESGDGSPVRGALVSADGVRHPAELTIEEEAFEEVTGAPSDFRIIVAERVGG